MSGAPSPVSLAEDPAEMARRLSEELGDAGDAGFLEVCTHMLSEVQFFLTFVSNVFGQREFTKIWNYEILQKKIMKSHNQKLKHLCVWRK